jgi:hypothetical protein
LVGVGEQRTVDGVGEVSFEGADGFGFGVAAGASALQELSGIGVVVGLGDRDAM